MLTMQPIVLHLLFGIWQYPMHGRGNGFVVAYEDWGSSIPGFSETSFLATDPEESKSFLDSDPGAGYQEDIFTGASEIDNTLTGASRP